MEEKKTSRKRLVRAEKGKKNGFEETRYESFTAADAVHIHVLEQDISDVIGTAFDERGGESQGRQCSMSGSSA